MAFLTFGIFNIFKNDRGYGSGNSTIHSLLPYTQT